MPLETLFFEQFILNSEILSHAEEKDLTLSLCFPGH